MEIIDNKPRENKPDNKVPAARNVYLGISLITAGIIWMCYNLGLVDRALFRVVFSWQMLMVVIGGYFMSVGKWTAGVIVMGLGVLFGLSRWFGIFLPVSEVVLPLVVVMLGVMLLLSKGK